MADRRDLPGEAREEFLAAAQKWVEGWAGEPGIVTSYLVIVEAAIPGYDARQCTFAASGASGEGLPRHQLLGMLADTEQECLASLIRFRQDAEGGG